MEFYSRFACEVAGARDRAQQLQQEAAEQRLIQDFRSAAVATRANMLVGARWRSRLAAQLHALAERLEPHPEPKESHV